MNYKLSNQIICHTIDNLEVNTIQVYLEIYKQKTIKENNLEFKRTKTFQKYIQSIFYDFYEKWSNKKLFYHIYNIQIKIRTGN